MDIIFESEDNLTINTICFLLKMSDEELKEMFGYKRYSYSYGFFASSDVVVNIKYNDPLEGECYHSHKNSVYDLCRTTIEEMKADSSKTFPFSIEELEELMRKVDDLRSRERFFEAVRNLDDENERTLLLKGLEAISSEEALNEFLRTNGNKDVVIALARLIGKDTFDEHQDICPQNDIIVNNVLSPEETERYLRLRKEINVDIELLGEEPFGIEGMNAYYKAVQTKTDSAWVVNEELRRYIFEGMNPDYSAEEKIAYMYIRMCQLFEYDVGFENNGRHTGFSKANQEGLSVENNRLMCAEFARLFSKLANEIPDIEARCIAPTGWGHEAVGLLFAKDNVRVNLEAINVKGNFNDLARAKLGLPLRGIEYIADRDNIFKDAFRRVYREMRLRQDISTENFVKAYEGLANTPHVEIDFEQNMNEFLNRIRGRVHGNETIIAFNYLRHLQYFGQIDSFFVRNFEGEEITEDIIINKDGEYYYLQTDAATIEKATKEELMAKIASGQIKFVDKKHVDEELLKEKESKTDEI